MTKINQWSWATFCEIRSIKNLLKALNRNRLVEWTLEPLSRCCNQSATVYHDQRDRWLYLLTFLCPDPVSWPVINFALKRSVDVCVLVAFARYLFVLRSDSLCVCVFRLFRSLTIPFATEAIYVSGNSFEHFSQVFLWHNTTILATLPSDRVCALFIS